MDLREQEYHDLAQRHPWEEARFLFFLGLARRAGLVAPTSTVLDVGSGDAWLARQLHARGPTGQVTCWDTGYTPSELARRGLAPDQDLRFVAERPRGRFDLLLLLDVLEHVEKDGPFLGELVAENMAPKGQALVSVPAWPCLFSDHDKLLRHHRRYTPTAARALLRASGLEIVESGGLFHALLLPRALMVLGERMASRQLPRKTRTAWSAPAVLTSLTRSVLAADNMLTIILARLGLSLPGLSWWARCRKTSP